ncbi:hypothetical protein BAE44_0025439, partial [Dichanthelium oligosanthes]
LPLLGVLLAELSPAVATARRDVLMMPAIDFGDQGRAANSNLRGSAARDGGEATIIIGRKQSEVVADKHRRFRTRKIPPAASSQGVPFGGRIPFTADYHSIRRHPPTHN